MKIKMLTVVVSLLTTTALFGSQAGYADTSNAVAYQSSAITSTPAGKGAIGLHVPQVDEKSHTTVAPKPVELPHTAAVSQVNQGVLIALIAFATLVAVFVSSKVVAFLSVHK
ncbi:hypothetical protein BKY29_04550 [Weissella confusa]|uniref:hypothetical protein n=1 Tax=Weissella confusa TaxID=1583 RepID=UPI0008FDDEF8|nr:hypothetical protein [Weissella confusa]OJF03820.1 hypothetical protein BKY29_04550 [Weissella confusa]